MDGRRTPAGMGHRARGVWSTSVVVRHGLAGLSSGVVLWRGRGWNARSGRGVVPNGTGSGSRWDGNGGVPTVAAVATAPGQPDMIASTRRSRGVDVPTTVLLGSFVLGITDRLHDLIRAA